MRYLALAFLLSGCGVYLSGNQTTLDDHTARIGRVENGVPQLVHGHNQQAEQIQSLEARINQLEKNKGQGEPK